MTNAYVHTFGIAARSKDQISLKYLSEMKSQDQAILYVLALPGSFPLSENEVYRKFSGLKIRFACTINRKPLFLETESDFPEFSFKVPNSKLTVDFHIDPIPDWFDVSLPPSKLPVALTYAGESPQHLEKNSFLLPIVPSYVRQIDIAYLNHDLVFVGLNPYIAKALL